MVASEVKTLANQTAKATEEIGAQIAQVQQATREAVEAVAAGRLDPSPLYTHRYKLDELAQALNDTRDRPMGFLKAIVTTS